MMLKHLYYPESRFGGFTRMDGTIAFYLRVNALLQPSFVVVDFGCGRGARQDDPLPIRRELATLKGKVHKVIGLDVDPAAAHNPLIDEFHLLQGDRWPLQDNSADLCLCDNVLEHLEHPQTFFAECRRVLRHQGYLCIRTSNAWNYIAIFSKLIPNRCHHTVLARVQERRKEEDVFPTYYRCNTLPALRTMLTQHGFQHVVYGHEAEPSYLSFSRIAYWLGTLHQRFAPNLLRATLFAFAQLQKEPG